MNKDIIKSHDNVEIHILSDGTKDEYDEYARKLRGIKSDNTWGPTNKNIFLQDIKSGIDFCKSKYGVTASKLVAYMKKELPHINTTKFKNKEA